MQWADRNGADLKDELARARMRCQAELAREPAKSNSSDERYPGPEREVENDQESGRGRSSI
jgi:hypothetical protein